MDININQVVLTGRITKDIELKQSQKGLPYCTFTLVVPKPTSFDACNYINCIAWSNVAKQIEGLEKGTYLGIVGSIETSQNKETKQNVQNVSVSRVYLGVKNTAKKEIPVVDDEPESMSYDEAMNKASGDLPF